MLGGGARSNEGYVVLFNHRTWIEFRDALGKVFIGAEMLVPPQTAALDPKETRVGTTQGPLLQDERRRRYVLERVRRAAAFLRWSLE